MNNIKTCMISLYLLPQFLISNRKWLSLCACGTLHASPTMQTCVSVHGKALTSELQLTLEAEMIISKCLSPVISPLRSSAFICEKSASNNKPYYVFLYFHKGLSLEGSCSERIKRKKVALSQDKCKTINYRSKNLSILSQNFAALRFIFCAKLTMIRQDCRKETVFLQ